jgi:hypothetical protein
MAIIAASSTNTVIGSGINTPPAQLVNTLNAVTQKYIAPLLGDNVFLPSPTWWALTRQGKQFGGGEIVYPLVTEEEPTGGAYYGDQLLNTAVVDSVQPADQVWRHYFQTVALPVTDIILNRGGTSALDIVKVKFQIASASFLQKLVRALWGTAPQNTSLDIDNIDAWIGQTTNTIAGINRSTAGNSFWQPAANVSGGSSALTPTVAEEAYQAVVYGYDEPDWLLLDNTRYGNFKTTFLASSSSAPGVIRTFDNYQDKEALQLGFRYHFVYNNAVVIPDRNMPANVGYLGNSRYLFPVFHEMDYFNVDPFIKPSNQRVVVSAMYLTWQLVCPSPRMGVKITAIS